ncbi:flagellar hook-associated protein 3 [Pseudomonas sp. FW306-02-F02-AA]|uniref:Flagellar biosynthesis protein FlgL n=1 Tax=Pseudomonas fluorescens TaxID=294 RepID=A0A0N9VWE6_PSEFL|nr:MULTISPECIES: flagellar hook-associated protein 3 [Pseudomonas]ALI02994.1 flagellar biosynthesis protein FlgL [Pseudomonas fluorescens]PMZ04151.1 flagellar hook-associated protein 3 [Pseudomonas sp. FW306-02-F02-AB]PMZ10306.1 flagellar hook-associated protein 3 [Pseudomonas sp. FW306-02-H06C]PMZ15733.1 flagellar hook-associated protein 3 [Pseudomonas sp. FW306-02-F02-AA]PMZ20910.1 flagellar hook-associated protein 3 [Pseudomonas sp. FW306-02-F08-AA]
MRISTAQFYQNTAANYQRNFNNLLKSADQASSGVKLETAGDDPVGAARLLQLDQQSAMLGQYTNNITALKTAQAQEESVLDSVNNVLQKVSELAVRAGGGSLNDDDRKSIAAELDQSEQQLLSLMNSKDANGNFLFSGASNDTAPFARNADGTYSYKGDQTQLQLKIGDSMSLGLNDSGWSVFQQAVNASRSQTTMTAPAVDDGRVALSPGLVSSGPTFNSSFRSGEPYTLSFLSSTQFQIKDGAGNDVTAEATQGGTFDPNAKGGSDINFRGVTFGLDVTFQSGDTAINADAVIAGHSFQLTTKPDTIASTRNPGNPSTALVSQSTVTNPADYAGFFPDGGAVLKFTSATTFDLYASPLTSSSQAVSSGTVTAGVATAAGISFTMSGTPAANDQFDVSVNAHQTQNVLDTVSQLRQALETPVQGNPTAQRHLKESIASAIANLGNAKNQVDLTRGAIGARGNVMDLQSEQNQSAGLINASTQSDIKNTDPAEVLTRLTLQQTMLQAAQLAFSKISQLGLFNKL